MLCYDHESFIYAVVVCANGIWHIMSTPVESVFFLWFVKQDK